MSTTTPRYAPREGTKLAEACAAIEKAGGLSCEPLSRILGCTMYEVATFLSTPVKRGYLVKEKREGVAFFVMGEQVKAEPVTAKPAAVAIPAELPEAAAKADELFTSGYQACLEGQAVPKGASPHWLRGYNAYVPPVPEVLPEPDPVIVLKPDLVAAADDTIEAGLDWHAYEPAESVAPTGRYERALAEAAFARQSANDFRADSRIGLVEDTAPREFACAFSSAREIGMTIGDQRIDLSIDEAQLLRKMLQAMHKAGLMA